MLICSSASRVGLVRSIKTRSGCRSAGFQAKPDASPKTLMLSQPSALSASTMDNARSLSASTTAIFRFFSTKCVLEQPRRIANKDAGLPVVQAPKIRPMPNMQTFRANLTSIHAVADCRRLLNQGFDRIHHLLHICASRDRCEPACVVVPILARLACEAVF